MKFLIGIIVIAAIYFSGITNVGPYHLKTNTQLRGGKITGTVENASFRRVGCIRTEVALLDNNNRVYQTLSNTAQSGLWPGARSSFTLNGGRASGVRSRSRPC